MQLLQEKEDTGARKKTSKVWKYFIKEGAFVKCTVCKRKLKYHSNTSPMLNHLKTHPLPKEPRASTSSTGGGHDESDDTDQNLEQRQTTLVQYARPKLTPKMRKDITRLLVNVIVKDTRPLALVSGRGFKELLHYFQPDYIIPSHATLWKYINLQYDQLREQLSDGIKDQSISLTTDIWTSSTMMPYITVTAHYISDTWEMQSKVLVTCLMPERHTRPTSHRG